MTLRPSSLRLHPRGRLVLSLVLIACAVALPTIALIVSTRQVLARGEAAMGIELQTLRRLRLESAARAVEDEIRARAARSGVRLPVGDGIAGEVFRDLMAGTRADSLLVLEPGGGVAYPAPANPMAEPTDVDERGEELVDGLHEQVHTNGLGEGYLRLAAQFREEGLEGARSQSGRLYLAGVELAALRELPSGHPGREAVLGSIRARVTSYGMPVLPATQRLFLRRELAKEGVELGPGWSVAEALGLEVAAVFRLPPAASVLTATGASAGGDAFWALMSPGGGVVWLYRQERLRAELESVANRALAKDGYSVRLGPVTAGPTGAGVGGVRDGEGFSAGLAGAWPGWELRVVSSPPPGEFERAVRRQARVQVGTSLIAVLLGAVLAALAVRRFHREARLTEVRHDFLTTVSHELRTPMTSIRMLVDTLVADPEPKPERTRQYLDIIARETLRLSRLVDDYLTFARLERGRMNYDFQPVAPEQVVESVVKSVSGRFAAAGCDFRVELAPGLPQVRADLPSLTTALLNLLENAFKYTGAEKRILLTVSRRGESVVFAVTDNGRGFDPRLRDRIFEKFYRADERGAGGTGVGLGLHIVKAIVEAHEGGVEVETTPGEGSRFALRIPVSSGEESDED